MDFENSQDYKKIFNFSGSTGYKLLSREGSSIEFKESFNWGSKDKYAKSAIAFANNKGGYIIFGVKDRPRELVGLQSTNFETLDEATITQYLNSAFSPEIVFEKFIVSVRNKTVGILRIPESKQKPIVTIKNDGDIKEGEIYYRYNGRTDKVKFPELKTILNQIQENERKHWMSLFERISRIGPENTALVDMAEGKIECNTGTLVIDHKLIPKLKFIQEGNFRERGSPTLKLIGEVRPVSIVGGRTVRGGGMRITDDPNAPTVRIKEDDLFKEFSLEYRVLTRNLYDRYSDFKSNEKYHKIRKDLAAKGFAITRHLNPRNTNSPKQEFYSPRIYKEFDKYYSKK